MQSFVVHLVFLTLHSFDRPLPDIESYASLTFRSANVGFQTLLWWGMLLFAGISENIGG